MTDKCKICVNFIIEKANKNKIKLHATILQTILFHSYVDYAILQKKPLFKDIFYAWTNGPVIPDIYNEYFKYTNLVFCVKKINSGESLSKKEEYVLSNAFDRLVNKDIHEIKEKNTQKNSLWSKRYSDNLIKQLSIEFCGIPFKEICEFYKKEENYKQLFF